MVYLLHFSRPYRHARHYIGYAATPATLARRLAHHRAGADSKLCKIVADTGGDFELAHVWEDGNRTL